MTVYKNDDILFGKTEYRRQNIPSSNLYLKDNIDVTPDDEIKIIGNYTKSSSTRIISSGTNGVTTVSTATFTSAGSNFDPDVQVGDMLIIKGTGSDAGSYIVDTVVSDTELTLDDHSGSPVSFSGDTGLEYEVGIIIFKGLIDKTDFEANQTIQVYSRAEEIQQVRPTGTYSGPSEIIMARMIENSNFSHIQLRKTSATITLLPDGDVDIDGWDDPNGNNNNIMYDDVDDDYAIPDGNYIESPGGIGPDEKYEFSIADHSLSGDYHYNIYQVRLYAYHRLSTGLQRVRGDFYNGSIWSTNKDMSGGLTTTDWVSKYATWSSLQLNEADINDFKFRIFVNAVSGSLWVDEIKVVIYYYTYDDFDKASYTHDIVCQGEKSVEDYANLFVLQEQMTWYLDTDLYFYLNDGSEDTGEDFASTDSMKYVIGNRNNKTYSQVILYGGYIEGVQLTATSGSGFPIWKDTYSNIDNQTQLNNLAASILTEQSANQYIIQLMRHDTADGLYQVGETVSLPDDPDDIPFSNSDKKIPTGQYIINKIDYFINNGLYNGLDVEIIDGLIFSKPPEDELHTATHIGTEATVQISQITDLIDDDAFGVGWDGKTTQGVAKNALYDIIMAIQNSVSIHLTDASGGALMSNWSTQPIVNLPAADNSCQANYQGYMPSGWEAMTNPTLIILYGSAAGDSWSVTVRADSGTSGESASTNNLHTAGVTFTTSTGSQWYKKEVVLSGTISPGDIIGVRLMKTSSDSENLNVGCTLWIER